MGQNGHGHDYTVPGTVDILEGTLGTLRSHAVIASGGGAAPCQRVSNDGLKTDGA
jgi:hypothetical protein